MTDRFQADLNRAREYIEAAKPRVHMPAVLCQLCSTTTPHTHNDAPPTPWFVYPVNLTDALFGPYTCRRCCSYLHRDEDHGGQR